ncbi:Uma2 family endonuclease [Aetokthonos hydrillicola Thurmond2011]|jgi:Uma2 family endonuclease|uniref:Uma2 family endonuclease n=1 Tax=Aetokthonos hydrillicola Thurmond2011 TaxID=2712845 RepID=A0AAP5I4X6_9CYAN|nr:Uma2 family endonuclease [Aetokthonos hydrillicola]MBO3457521.1 Uma2 family endonuclease [Aetokthonos hydrillicola CCALA 1050]MBW4585955.1 Uma2 family endonuclease [Aetokthonos hydrillicola CCALA 1050]MDR9893817.1 Uma2 family endonuclease [Aetokthonos hydrillicola Thurmond2011]
MTTHLSRQPHAKSQDLPTLENGDRLTRFEFERRYAAMPHLKKAELIEGVVYVAAALRFRNHGQPHAQLLGWLFNYQVATPGIVLADNTTVRLDRNNEPQPDITLFLDPTVGGQVKISEDDYIEGAPELIAEVAASSASYDLGDKKKVYLRNGVQEYIVWQMFENRLDWFVLQDDDYVVLLPDTDGIIRSPQFPGLWLAVNALLVGDMVQVLAVLQQGLTTPEHKAFVQQLSKHHHS